MKHKLTLARAATLSRHAAELKTLDTQQEEIEKFADLVSRFAENYLTADQAVLQPTGSDEKQFTESHIDEDHSVREIEEHLMLRPDALATVEESAAASEVPWGKPSDLDVEHVSPNFGIPLRKFVGR